MDIKVGLKYFGIIGEGDINGSKFKERSKDEKNYKNKL